jgi:phosphate/sulfate permease
MMWFAGPIIALLVAGFIYAVWKTATSRRLSSAASFRIRSLIDKANRMPNPVLRILEYDKVLDQLLLELRFQGSTGEKLMKGGARFSNQQELWKCHKLRNIVAHQSGATASNDDADHFRVALEHALKQVGR